MASQDPSDSEVCAFDRAVFFQRLDEIGAAGRCEPAGRREKRRDENLISPYDYDQYSFKKTADVLHLSLIKKCSSAERVAERPLDILFLCRVDAISCYKNDVVPLCDGRFQRTEGFLHEPARAVPADAVSNFFARDERYAVFSEAVPAVQYDDVFAAL